jgi:hypothetical protein
MKNFFLFFLITKLFSFTSFSKKLQKNNKKLDKQIAKRPNDSRLILSPENKYQPAPLNNVFNNLSTNLYKVKYQDTKGNTKFNPSRFNNQLQQFNNDAINKTRSPVTDFKISPSSQSLQPPSTKQYDSLTNISKEKLLIKKKEEGMRSIKQNIQNNLKQRNFVI